MDITERYDLSSEDMESDHGDMIVSAWKREINGKVFQFTSIQRPDSAQVHVSEVITTYEPIKAIEF